MHKLKSDKRRTENHEWFTVSVDGNKLCYQAVETDNMGNLFLHKSQEPGSGGHGGGEEYYIIDTFEAMDLAKQALQRKMITKEEHDNIVNKLLKDVQ